MTAAEPLVKNKGADKNILPVGEVWLPSWWPAKKKIILLRLLMMFNLDIYPGETLGLCGGEWLWEKLPSGAH